MTGGETVRAAVVVTLDVQHAPVTRTGTQRHPDAATAGDETDARKAASRGRSTRPAPTGS